jgi:Flp pilus assembly protein CpaB
VLRRRPVAYWAVAAIAVGCAWWGTQSALDRMTAGTDAYGGLVPVVVATRDISPGQTLTSSDIAVVDLPERLVPGDVIDTPPIGAVARDQLVEGEAIASARLAPDGAVGVAATLSPDERAVAIGTDRYRPPLRPGQRVDVLATTDPTSAGRSGPTTTVATAARVLTVDDDGITVAVGREASLDLATALATSVDSVVVTPD